MKRRKGTPDDLTSEEIDFLRSDAAAPLVRQFAARQHEVIGVRATAYRKVAAAARAERDAIVEIAALEVARLAVKQEADAVERLGALKAENAALRRALDAAHRKVEAITAAPAMAQYGEATSR